MLCWQFPSYFNAHNFTITIYIFTYLSTYHHQFRYCWLFWVFFLICYFNPFYIHIHLIISNGFKGNRKVFQNTTKHFAFLHFTIHFLHRHMNVRELRKTQKPFQLLQRKAATSLLLTENKSSWCQIKLKRLIL